jgi:hypothetical protein
MRPGMILVHRQTCMDDADRTEIGTARQIGRHRTARGLTEVRLEIDGELAGEYFLDDDGHVVDARSENPFVRRVHALLFQHSTVDDAAFMPLERNQPRRMSLPMSQAVKDLLPQIEWIQIPPMRMTIEYLGQTNLDGRRVAGYSTKGFVEHAMPGSAAISPGRWISI